MADNEEVRKQSSEKCSLEELEELLAQDDPNDDIQYVPDETHIPIYCSKCIKKHVGVKYDHDFYVLRCNKCDRTFRLSQAQLDKHPPIQNGVEMYVGDLLMNRFERLKQFEASTKHYDSMDAYAVDDDYRRLVHLEPSIRRTIEATKIDLQRIVNSYRKTHNYYVLTDLIGLKECIHEAIINGVKKKDRPRIFLVEVQTKDQNLDTIVLDPNAFKFPDTILAEIKKTGLQAIREVDKYLLEVGIPKEFIVNEMPRFRTRYEFYKKKVTCSYDPNKLSNQCAHSEEFLKDIYDPYMEKSNIKEDDIDRENDRNNILGEEKQCNGKCHSIRKQAADILKKAKSHARMHKREQKDQKNCDCEKKNNKKGARAHKCTHKKDGTTQDLSGTMCVYRKCEHEVVEETPLHCKILLDNLAIKTNGLLNLDV